MHPNSHHAQYNNFNGHHASNGRGLLGGYNPQLQHHQHQTNSSNHMMNPSSFNNGFNYMAPGVAPPPGLTHPSHPSAHINPNFMHPPGLAPPYMMGADLAAAAGGYGIPSGVNGAQSAYASSQLPLSNGPDDGNFIL